MKSLKLSKVALATAIVIFSGSALAVPGGSVLAFKGSGQDKLVIKGKLKKTNSCDVHLNKGGLFDIGTLEIKDKLDEAGGVFAEKNFVARVKCDYPSAVILGWTSSRSGAGANVTNPKNFSKTFSPMNNKVYNTRVMIKDTVTSPTQNNLKVTTALGAGAYSALASTVGGVGASNFNGSGKIYLSTNSLHRKYVAFTKSNTFATNEVYRLPFTIQLKSRPYSEWIDDMASGKLKLNEQITIKSYII